MPTLSNLFLNFEFDPNTAQWDLRWRGREWPALERVRGGVQWRDALGARHKWEGRVREVGVATAQVETSPHGPLDLLTAVLTPAPERLPITGLLGGGAQLQITLEFALPRKHPFLLWRFRIQNLGPQTISLLDSDLAHIGSRFGPLQFSNNQFSALHLHPEAQDLAFYSNGYQSWSFTGALQSGMRNPLNRTKAFDGPKFFNLRNPVVDSLGHFTSDMFAVVGDNVHNVGLVLGFTAQKEQFGVIESLLIDARAPFLSLTTHGDGVPLAAGEARETDWAYAQFIEPSGPDPLAEYLDAVARENQARVPAHTPVGWCSWYHYFDKVTEANIIDNVAAIAQERERLPLDFVQIDDGFQAQVGDWFDTKPTFASGLPWLTAHIRQQGFTPGLWLAPYIVRSDAQLNRLQPEWFLRDRQGRRAGAGLNWFRWCYALDPTHPGVREHTHQLIHTAVKEWGFPYLKLDFLYAAALPAQRYNPQFTRAQAMRLALQDIRDAAGEETFLLGCGCPLGPAIGLMDGMRISTDVAPNWHPELLTPRFSRWLEDDLAFVSARNAIQNIISRAALHRRWWLNDPDCLLVRDRDTRLTEAEVQTLASVIGLSGGMFLVSDDMSQLNPARHRYISTLLPVLNVRPRVPGWLSERVPNILTLPMSNAAGNWLVVGLFNWDDVARALMVDWADLGLSAGTYWCADFWHGTIERLETSAPLATGLVPPHGVRLLALRSIAGKGEASGTKPSSNFVAALPDASPLLVASSFHFSQGGEIAAWEFDGQTLCFTVELGRTATGTLHLALPTAPRTVNVDSQTLSAEQTPLGLYALTFTVHGSATIQISF